MKTAYLNKEAVNRDLREWLPETRQLEKRDKEAAIKEYKRMVVAYPVNEEIYNRIMILCRQLKEPQEEMRWIDKAIVAFEKSFNQTSSKTSPSAKVKSLSKSILQSTGLMDKKGKALYRPQPIGRWQKRKDLLKARLARAK